MSLLHCDEMCFSVLQVVVSSYEAANSIIIVFDMDNSIFGLPREFVVASAGKHVYEKASNASIISNFGYCYMLKQYPVLLGV